MRKFYKVEDYKVIEMTSKQVISELKDSVNYDVYKDGVLYTCFRGKLTPWVEQPKDEDQAIDWIACELVGNEMDQNYFFSEEDTMNFIVEKTMEELEEELEAKMEEEASSNPESFFLGYDFFVSKKAYGKIFTLVGTTDPVFGFFTQQEFLDSPERDSIISNKIKEVNVKLFVDKCNE